MRLYSRHGNAYIPRNYSCKFQLTCVGVPCVSTSGYRYCCRQKTTTIRADCISDICRRAGIRIT